MSHRNKRGAGWAIIITIIVGFAAIGAAGATGAAGNVLQNIKNYMPLIMTPNQPPRLTPGNYEQGALPTKLGFTLRSEGYPIEGGVSIFDDSPLGSLHLTATSSNQSVLQNAKIGITEQPIQSWNTYATFTVVVTPTSEGSTVLTLTGTDGQNQTTHTIAITVRAANSPPVFSHIGNQTLKIGTPLTINFTVTDPDNDLVEMGGEADNGDLFDYAYGGSGTNRTLTITPKAAGTTGLYIYASDGFQDDREPTTEHITLTIK